MEGELTHGNTDPLSYRSRSRDVLMRSQTCGGISAQKGEKNGRPNGRWVTEDDDRPGWVERSLPAAAGARERLGSRCHHGSEVRVCNLIIPRFAQWLEKGSKVRDCRRIHRSHYTESYG